MKQGTSLQILQLKRIIREYYKKFINQETYQEVHKFSNLVEIDQFIKDYKLSKFNPIEIDHLTSPITIKNSEFIMWKLPKRKSPGPGGFTGEF